MNNKKNNHIELEEITLCTITKKNGQTNIEITNDTTMYELLGILKTYTKYLEKELIKGWNN